MTPFEEFLKNHQQERKKIWGWIVLKNRNYDINEVIEAIYRYAGGKTEKTVELINKLTQKSRVAGRGNVASDEAEANMDVRRDSDGELKVCHGDIFKEPKIPGQKHSNPKFLGRRKSDNQTSTPYKKTSEILADIGKPLRAAYPGASPGYIANVEDAIRDFQFVDKGSLMDITKRLIDGKLKLDDNDMKKFVIHYPNEKQDPTAIVPKRKRQRIVRVREDMVHMLREELEMTEYKFFSNVKSFLSKLLSDPVNAAPSDFLQVHDLGRKALLKKLIDNKIIEKDEKISDKDENGEPKTATMKVKYKVPKKDFEYKLKKLYIKLFEKNVPEKENVNEEGEGATSADSSGQFTQPAFPVQRRSIYNLDETDTNSVGDYCYDVPFVGDKETLARKNGVGGSVSINKA